MDKEELKKVINEQIEDFLSKSENSASQIPKHIHNGVDSLPVKYVNLGDIIIQKVSDASVSPTDTPLEGTIRYYYDGTDFFQWNYINRVWTGTQLGGNSEPQQYVFTTYTHNNTGFAPANYTDTITTTFTPHTVFFYGRQYTLAGGLHYSTNGQALKFANVTTGSSAWVRAGSSGVLSSKLGGISVNDFVEVTTWGSTGVTLSTTLSPGGGGDNLLEGMVLLIG